MFYSTYRLPFVDKEFGIRMIHSRWWISEQQRTQGGWISQDHCLTSHRDTVFLQSQETEDAHSSQRKWSTSYLDVSIRTLIWDISSFSTCWESFHFPYRRFVFPRIPICVPPATLLLCSSPTEMQYLLYWNNHTIWAGLLPVQEGKGLLLMLSTLLLWPSCL